MSPTKAVEGLNKGLRNRAMRIALNAGAAPVKAATISAAPADSGALKKSFRIRVKNYKNSSVWVAVIGSKSDFIRKKKGKSKKPGNYMALVDRGTKFMRGRHYMESALNRTRSQFVQVFSQKLREQIEALANKK